MDLLNEDKIFIVNKEIKRAEQTSNIQIIPVIIKNSSRPVEFLKVLSLLSLGLSAYYSNVFFMLIAIGCFVMFKRLSSFLTKNRATLEFYLNKLDSTSGKNGVLLFISLKEHKVFVLCDSHIARFVENSAWENNVVQKMRKHLKDKNLCEATIEGLRGISQVVSENVPIEKTGINDREDKVIQKE